MRRVRRVGCSPRSRWAGCAGGLAGFFDRRHEVEVVGDDRDVGEEDVHAALARPATQRDGPDELWWLSSGLGGLRGERCRLAGSWVKEVHAAGGVGGQLDGLAVGFIRS